MKEFDGNQIPMRWETFDEIVEKLKQRYLDELKSELKQDEQFQKEYVEQYSRFADDQILILKGENKEKLEKLHRRILKDLADILLKI